MKPSSSGSWLVLQSGSACLQQVYPELMQLKTLVGLGVQATDQVLMVSLERMSGWVLNLVDPHAAEPSWLLRSAMQQGLRAVQQVPGKHPPARRLFVALDAMLQTLFQGLMALRISPGAGGQGCSWGIYSCSLSGWSKAHQCTHIQWQLQAPWPTAVPAPYGLFAGRLLAGATLAFFEDQCPAALATLGHPGTPLVEEEPSPAPAPAPTQDIVTAACALVQRGIWNPQTPPYRLWRWEQQWHLLWPLAGTDLQRELCALDARHASEDAGQWLQRLSAAGCVQQAPEGAVGWEIHPHTGKKVRAVVASGALAHTLERLQGAQSNPLPAPPW